MLGVFLDMVVIVLGKMTLEHDDSPDFREIAIPALIITVCNFAIAFLLGPVIGLFALIPMAVVAVIVLLLMCQMTIRNAAITAAAMIAVRIALSMLMRT